VPLIIRFFSRGDDIQLWRLWEFHDHLATRLDISYYLHVLSPYSGPGYSGPAKDLQDRSYVIRKRSLPVPSSSEVWIIRSWNHPLLVLAAILARSRRIPIVMWSERPGQTWEATDLKHALRIRLRELLLPILFMPYRKGTILLGTGQKAVEAFRELSHGAPARVFPYPDPVADACLETVRFQERNGLPLFLFAGEFKPRKAIDIMVSASEKLWQSGYRFRIRYVGSGPLRDTLAEHVKRSGNLAELYPFADRAMLLKHYEEADAVLLPSRFDGWGLPVQEGLASGVPVVVSEACGAADLIAQSGCGKVIQANSTEALEEAMSWVVGLGAQEKETIRKKALEVAHRLTIPKLTDELLAYCNEALQQRSK
jgi:glycosyltransferase involved in cell wall biosynthesis